MVNLDIQKDIRELRSVLTKAQWLAQSVAEKGADIAQEYFDGAEYDGVNDVRVSVRRNGKEAYVAEIVAQGEAVCFIEFGSGVYYNGGGSYPLPLPKGVVGIGEYGKGKGKEDFWIYRGEPGNAGGEPLRSKPGYTITHGNIAWHPMYNTSVDLNLVVKEIAEELING